MPSKTLALPADPAVAASHLVRRSSLLGLVIAAHAAVVLSWLAARTVTPQRLEAPLVVDFIPPPEPPKTIEAKPLPIAKAQPVLPNPQPWTPQLPIEATTSLQPVANTPTAVPVESKPVLPAPASEPVNPARFDADYLKNPAPPYPPAARRRGEEGKVVLRVQVSPQGSAEAVEIKTSSGSARLDEAAADTVHHWNFIPARRGETPLSSWVLVPIVFKLEQ